MRNVLRKLSRLAEGVVVREGKTKISKISQGKGRTHHSLSFWQRKSSGKPKLDIAVKRGKGRQRGEKSKEE